MTYENQARKILEKADVEINGKNPWDMQVHNPRMFQRVFSQGTLGLGESYMDGDWDCKKLDEFFYKVLRKDLEKELKWNFSTLLTVLKAKVFNLQNRSHAFEIGEKHYDTGNDLYEAMLDKRLTYTCAYWDLGAKTLDEAQEDKLELTCRKIGLNKEKEENVLDIGGGWGSFAKYAAQNYGTRVKAITVSKEQVELGKELTNGISNVEIRLQDYRDLGKNEMFDHIVSLGMFEHVGVKNYKEYFKVVRNHLKDGGLFLLHTIGNNESQSSTDPWISKYIFPNSVLPSQKQIAESVEGIFIEEDSHNLSTNYDKTLMTWYNNIHNSWDKLNAKGEKYNKKFKRMWEYYLLSCAGSFRARRIQVWQKVFSKNGVLGGYKSIR